MFLDHSCHADRKAVSSLFLVYELNSTCLTYQWHYATNTFYSWYSHTAEFIINHFPNMTFASADTANSLKDFNMNLRNILQTIKENGQIPQI